MLLRSAKTASHVLAARCHQLSQRSEDAMGGGALPRRHRAVAPSSTTAGQMSSVYVRSTVEEKPGVLEPVMWKADAKLHCVARRASVSAALDARIRA